MNNTGRFNQLGNSLGCNVPARQPANTVTGNRKTVAFASANDSESIKYSENIDNQPIPGAPSAIGMTNFYNDLVAQRNGQNNSKDENS